VKGAVTSAPRLRQRTGMANHTGEQDRIDRKRGIVRSMSDNTAGRWSGLAVAVGCSSKRASLSQRNGVPFACRKQTAVLPTEPGLHGWPDAFTNEGFGVDKRSDPRQFTPAPKRFSAAAS